MKVLFAPMYGSNPYQANLSEELERVGVDVHPLEPVLFLCVVRALVRHADVDVVHFHWLDAFYSSRWFAGRLVLAVLFVPQLLVLRLHGATVVWTVHNHAAHETESCIEQPVKRVFVTLICDWMIVHCDEARTRLVETYDLSESICERTTVVPHGHYIDSYSDTVSREEARDHLALGDDATVFLFFGEIRPYKNVEALVETFRELRLPDSHLIVAGRPRTGDDGEAIRSAAAASDRVSTRLEFVPERDVQRYMKAADAVVLPFRDVLTSGSAVLSMSFGRPFVAPAIGCLPELAGEDTAILYSQDDPDGLARALRTATTADLDAMGERGRERVARHDWATVATRTKQVYEAAR